MTVSTITLDGAHALRCESGSSRARELSFSERVVAGFVRSSDFATRVIVEICRLAAK